MRRFVPLLIILVAWQLHADDSNGENVIAIDPDKNFVVSDPHFGQFNIIKFRNRPFRRVSEMNEFMIASWNATVPWDGTVWILGDVSSHFEVVKRVLPRLNGRKILVLGNHDLPHPDNQYKTDRDKQEWLLEYKRAGFAEIYMNAKVQAPGYPVVNLCHYPYPGECRKTAHQLENDGTALLCGHVHNRFRRKGNMLNVSVEVQQYRPIAFRQAFEELGLRFQEALHTGRP